MSSSFLTASRQIKIDNFLSMFGAKRLRLCFFFLVHLLEKSQLMAGSEINLTIVHLAHANIEKTEGLDSLALVGIRRRGVPIAERLAQKIRQLSSSQLPIGTLDIQLYRDDLLSGVEPNVPMSGGVEPLTPPAGALCVADPFGSQGSRGLPR